MLKDDIKFQRSRSFKKSLLLAMQENKLRKKTIEKELGCSYPTVLNKLKDPLCRFSITELFVL